MKKALVAGALGVSGRALVHHLVALADWEVIGLSRRKPEFATPAPYVVIDLLTELYVDASSVSSARLRTSSRRPAEEGNSSRKLPPTWLCCGIRGSGRTFVCWVAQGNAAGRGEVLWRAPRPVQDAGEGGRPAATPPNFYYDQQDYLAADAAGKTLVVDGAARSSICGFAVGNPMNMATVIAV